MMAHSSDIALFAHDVTINESTTKKTVDGYPLYVVTRASYGENREKWQRRKVEKTIKHRPLIELQSPQSNSSAITS